MVIKPSEIDSVDSIGELDGEDVKIVRTVGGLYIAISKLKNKAQEEVLSAGSHPAIVRFNVEKSYKSFRPSMMKSESHNPEVVAGMTELLPKSLKDKGYDFYTIKKSNQVDLVLTKSQMEVLRFEGELVDNDYIVNKPTKMLTSELSSVATAATTAAAIVALEEGKTSILHANTRYDAQTVLDKKW